MRTPMQWSTAPQAGFTGGRPWLPVSSDYDIVNVAAQRRDPTSMLALYARLIALRQAEPVLQVGSFRIFRTTNDVVANVLTYTRGDSFLVALNLGGRPQRAPLPRGGVVVLSTHLDRAEERVGETLELRPDEGLILRLTN
jgi:alpha-glucosidase